MKKQIVSILTAATLLCTTTSVASAALSDFTTERTYSGQFTDVASNAWYYDNVKTAYELGLVNGSSATTYSPDDNITIAEVQTLVARIHSTYYGNTIEPADGAWYAPYVEYCMEHIDREVCSMAYMLDGNVVTADLPASRSYFAYLMYAALPASEYQQINTVPDGSLPDVDDIVFFDAPERIYALYRAGILTGNDAYGTFYPDSNITRAEVAAIIARMVDPAQRRTFALDQPPFGSNLSGFTGSYFISVDPNRPWFGYKLTIFSVTPSGVSFDFQYEKSGHAIVFTAEDAQFIDDNTAVGYGITAYGDTPNDTQPVRYELTFATGNIHLNIYVSSNTTAGYSIDYPCTGVVTD